MYYIYLICVWTGFFAFSLSISLSLLLPNVSAEYVLTIESDQSWQVFVRAFSLQ